MTRILCARHGPSGIALVCSHLRSSVSAGSPLGEYTKWEVLLEVWSFPHWFCPNCLDALNAAGLPPSGHDCESCDDDHGLDQIFETVEGTQEPVCFICFTNASDAKTDQRPRA